MLSAIGRRLGRQGEADRMARMRQQMLARSTVDGIIAGYAEEEREYDDSPKCANAIRVITDWVKQHGTTHRMANSADRMFH